MRFFSKLTEQHASDSPGVAAFLDDMRNLFVEAPRAAVADAHLASIVEAARTAGAAALEPAIAGRRTRHRRTRIGAVAAGLAVLAALSGAAYAGALPGPVQGKVADIAKNVGISLPGTHHDVNQGDVGNTNKGGQGNGGATGPTTTTGGGAQGDTGQGKDSGAQGNRDDGSKGNADNGAAGDAQNGASDTIDGGTKGADKAGDSTPQGSDSSQHDTVRVQTDQTEPTPIPTPGQNDGGVPGATPGSEG